MPSANPCDARYLQGYPIDPTAPADTYVLAYNLGTGKYVPTAPGGGGGGTGTVTSIPDGATNGVSWTVANRTTVPAFTFTLGNITPGNVAATGAISGSNFSGNSSGTNTGDQSLAGLLTAANNLSDLISASTARGNLGLGTLATQNGTFSGTHSGNSSGTNTGDQTSVSGNAGTATALANGRTIGITGDLVWTSPSFDGSGNVTAVGAIGTGVIVDADVNAAAAITLSKISGAAASGANADITALSALATVSTITENAIGASPPAIASVVGVGLLLKNTTAATNVTAQTTPTIRLSCSGWSSGSSASQDTTFQLSATSAASSVPTSTLNIQFSVNAGAFTTPFALTNVGGLTLLAGLTCTTIGCGAITSTGSVVGGSASTLGLTSKLGITSAASGRVLFAGTGGAALTRFSFHAETSSDAAFQVSGTGITLGLADGTAGGSATMSGTLAVTGVTTFGAQARLKGYIVSTLPAGTQGDTAFVTDALTPTFLTTVVGGGAVVTTVFYNGTNWVSQ